MESVGGIGHHGGVGSEGLALGVAPVLPLVGLAHALVADLAVPVAVDRLVGAIVDGCHSGGDGGVGHGGGVHGVGNNRGVDSVGNHGGVVGNHGGGVHSVGNRVGNHGGGVDGVGHNGGNNLGGGVGRSRLGSVGRGGLVGGLLGVDSGALVGHIGDESVVAIGGVSHMLDPAVGESHGVGALHVGGAVGGLLGIEGRLGVVVSDGVGVGVGGDLVSVLLGLVGGGGGVVGGGLHHGGGIGGGGVHG